MLIVREKVDCAYMWNQTERKADLDDIDKLFLDGKLPKTKLYGYHSFGYAMFFKPDLTEVAKIICDAKLDADVYFVSTEPCDWNGDKTGKVVGGCLDESKDLHFGVTKVFFWKKQDQDPLPEGHPENPEVVVHPFSPSK